MKYLCENCAKYGPFNAFPCPVTFMRYETPMARRLHEDAQVRWYLA